MWPCAPAGAQGQAAPVVGALRSSIAANERHLWLIVETSKLTRIYHREAGGNFDVGRTTGMHVTAQAAVGDSLLVFFEDGSAYRYSPSQRRPTVEAVLPGREIPASLTGDDHFVYALVPSATARELTAPVEQESETPPPSFDPGNAAWSMVFHDGSRWHAAATLPTGVSIVENAALPPQLCMMRDELLLFAAAPAAGQLQYFRYEGEKREWTALASISLPPMSEYWAVSLSRVPALATARRDAEGAAHLEVYRLLKDANAADWRRTPIELSALPTGVEAAEYLAAAGFNQHLCVLARDKRGGEHLLFGRASGTPAETTQSVSELLSEQGTALRGQRLVQIATFMILLTVLTGLFVFRRGSMVRAVELPPGAALALMMQRILAWVIDFAPFVIVVGKIMRVSAYDGLSTLLQWGVSPDPDGGTPEAELLIWWALAVAAYTVYCLFMEIAARRTIGKMIARIYVVSENGAAPSFGQLMGRNFTRLIECMPQFWVFVALVLLSRNRQRLGDIFARTVVVRAVRRPTPPTRNGADGKEEAGDDVATK